MQWRFFEKHNTKNLQDFAQTQLDFEFFPDSHCKSTNADSYPDLSFGCIDAGAEKSFDSQIPFDPFEKGFYSLAVFVKWRDYQSVQ